MSEFPEVRYEAHPLVFRMHPVSTLLSLIAIIVGVMLVGVGRYASAQALSGLTGGAVAMSTDSLQLLGIALFALGGVLLYVRYAPAQFQRLTVTDDTLTYTQGFVAKRIMRIPLSEIKELKVDAAPWQRWLYIGDLSVYTGEREPTLVVKGLPMPEDIIPVFERRTTK